MVAKLLSSSQPKGRADGAGLESAIPLESTMGFPNEELQMMHFDFGQVPYGYGWVFPKGKWLSIGIGGVFKGEKSKPRHHFNTLLEGLPFTSQGSPGGFSAIPFLLSIAWSRRSHREGFFSWGMRPT